MFNFSPCLRIGALVLCGATQCAGDDALPDAKPVPACQALPLPHNEISLQFHGRELTRYVAPTGQPRPFWYPLAHSSGRSLTRMGHPHDPITHSHHNSVWISHQNVSGTSFWEDKQGANRPRIVQQKVEELWDGGQGCGATVVNDWLAADEVGGGRALLMSERRRFAAQLAQGVDPAAAWWLLVDLEFSAPSDKPVIFGVTAFGIIGVRLAKTMGVNDGGGRILNSEGGLNEPAVFRQPARWVDYSGPLANETTGGVTLMDHPQNPGHPPPFHVRNDGWMGPCLSFTAPLEIKPGSPLRLRYALFCHDSTLDREKIDSRWKEFAASAPVGAGETPKAPLQK
ncbi:MAG: DUF6807 family protein [Verrucomicrobiales bacterium]